jgi:hypothetical protein
MRGRDDAGRLRRLSHSGGHPFLGILEAFAHHAADIKYAHSALILDLSVLNPIGRDRSSHQFFLH